MPSSEIMVATVADRDGIVGSLVSAFTRDPVLRWLFPHDETYPRFAAAFFGHLFDKRVPRGTVWTIEHGAASALWDPPSTDAPAGPDDQPAHLLPDALPLDVLPLDVLPLDVLPLDVLPLDVLPSDALARMRAYDEAVHEALPTTPYWYLGVLGTHPDRAGHGLGRAVMRPGLKKAAEAGLPAYLETSNPGNVKVYEKAGWRVVHSLPAPVPTWVMTQ